jgi:FMN phosphatase YigB (HAD superfamily)
MSMPPVSACLVDIDGTITDDRDQSQIGPGHVLHNAVFDALRDVMVDHGWGADGAERDIAALADKVRFWDYPAYIQTFHLPPASTWERIRAWHERELIVYQDAVTMIKQLHRAGVRLFIVSNNPRTGCLLKLQRAGLGDLDGSTWFEEILGSNILHGQKGAVDHWRRALAHTRLDPETVAVVGDNDTEDHEIPARAGFRRFFIVDRRQK